MLGMIAAAAVLLGFSLLAFLTDVENVRARRAARLRDRDARARAQARRR
jgi:hypothetical protein